MVLPLPLFHLSKEYFLKQKSRTTRGSSFGSSAMFFKDPPLSVPSLQKVWLFRVSYFDLFCIKSYRICQIIDSNWVKREEIIDHKLNSCIGRHKPKNYTTGSNFQALFLSTTIFEQGFGRKHKGGKSVRLV
jgi:hypothetical protein